MKNMQAISVMDLSVSKLIDYCSTPVSYFFDIALSFHGSASNVAWTCILILSMQEYSVKNHVPSKQFFVGRFHQGIPHFAKKKTGETKWAMQKDGAQGRQLTDTQKV